MSEAFLHYIWKHQYFDKNNLLTQNDERVDIFKQGFYNTDSGPDFKGATIKINGMEWRGHVEIHLKSSDWQAHGHQRDPAYNSTILHVVWENDKPVLRQDKTVMPTLELCKRVDVSLQKAYKQLINNHDTIPCAPQLPDVPPIARLGMLDKALLTRLERKSHEVLKVLQANNNDWNETTYQLLARNFGFKVNTEPFFELAKSLPFKILKKHADKPLQVEALLFGQSGFLEEDCTDQYFVELKTEYEFLQKKYVLQQRLNKHQWKFLRLRPANFPTLRLAEFAAFIQSAAGLFSIFLQEDLKPLKERLKSELSAYWRTHYRFGEEAKNKINGLGEAGAQLICINTIVPILAAYATHIDDDSYLDRAAAFLQQLTVEKNRIIDKMKLAGFEATSAFDSQGLLELHNNFCLKKRCLHCNIGANLVRP